MSGPDSSPEWERAHDADSIYDIGAPLAPSRPSSVVQPEAAFRVVPIEEETDHDDDKHRPATDTRTSTQKFQQATRKVMLANRAISYNKGWTTGREPGIDPRHVDLPDLHNKVVVQVVDLCREDARFTVLENADVPGFLAKPRPEWAKVRWMHVNGLSWDVIKPIALEYNLHPLSLEDMLHHGQSAMRSKADYYKQHLFVSVVVHKTLASDAENDEIQPPLVYPTPSDRGKSSHHRAKSSRLREQLGFHSRRRQSSDSRVEANNDHLGSPGVLPGGPYMNMGGKGGGGPGENTPAGSSRASSFVSALSNHEKFRLKMTEAFASTKVKEEEESEARTLNSNVHGLTNKLSSGRRLLKKGTLGSFAEREAARQTVNVLTKDVKVHIHVEQLSIFVLRCGTVVSFSQDPGYHGRFSAIFDRIQSGADLIRDSEDPSFILQALLDVVADHSLEIVDEFRDQITRLESRVLARPDMSDVRHLHILSAQLLLLKSTLSPLRLLLHAIRLQDDAKAAAASRISTEQGMKNCGFVSYEAKVYLEDVIDHVESTLGSLDLFSSLAENLIAYTFNTISYSSNAYMQALSVLSVIFLPLTFLSGYFGMNFTTFPSVVTPDGNVVTFWKIAAPISVVTTLLFSWSYIVEGIRGLSRETQRVYRYSPGPPSRQPAPSIASLTLDTLAPMSSLAPEADPEKLSKSPQDAQSPSTEVVPPTEAHHDRLFDLEGGTGVGSSGPQPSAIVTHASAGANRKSTAPFGISAVVEEAQKASSGLQPDLRTPKQKLQSAVRKIGHVNRAVSYTKIWARTNREPGIDDARFSCLRNADVPAFLAKPRAEWVKVRWLHVNGLSWDVIKPIALKYNLHPLALEDLLHHGTASTKSKLNYFKDQLFVSVVVHKTLASDRENASVGTGDSSGHKTTDVDSGKPSNAHGHMSKSHDPKRDGIPAKDAARQAARHIVTSQTKDYSIHVHVEQLSIFVLRDGTIISFTQDPGFHKRFSAVMDRARSPTDIIRTSADSSFVLQGLLDVVSDHALEIVDDITEVEARVLVKPYMKDVKRLHVLSAQLILLKTTISPFQQLLQGIRNHDDIKAAAACHAADHPTDGKGLGFVSLNAKIYIEDVMEHVDSVMTSLDLFSDLAENLIAYTFNTISYSSNSYMQGLSVLSVIFLPLTFLSGYFGMNFTTFPNVVTPDGNCQ
ncbi:hypothetical protein RQP46_006857 [Phenoliferia psychrophenolica]